MRWKLPLASSGIALSVARVVTCVVCACACAAAACNTAELLPQAAVQDNAVPLVDGGGGGGDDVLGDDDASPIGTGTPDSAPPPGDDTTPDATMPGDDDDDASAPPTDAGGGTDTGTTEAGPHDGGTKAACATTFGSALTTGYGRIDGTLTSQVAPTDTTCAQNNTGDLVLEVSVAGATYHLSIVTDGTTSEGETDHALVGPAYAEGWHQTADVSLDYVNTLSVHSTALTQYAKADMVNLIDSKITFGAPISIYLTEAYAGAGGDLIHREGANHDGAIVVNPGATTPHWLLFRLASQTF